MTSMASQVLQALIIPSLARFLSPAPPPPTRPLHLPFPFKTPPLRSDLTTRSTAAAPKAKPNASGGDQKWTHEGSVTESLPNGMFRVKLDNEDFIIGYISGKIRKNFVRILPGDRVKVEVSRYDTSRGRIVYRQRTGARDPNAE